MTQPSFLISLPRSCAGKPGTQPCLFDESHDSLHWQRVKPNDQFYDYPSNFLVLDPVVHIYQHFANIIYTHDTVVVPSTHPEKVYEVYEQYTTQEIQLDVNPQTVSKFGTSLLLTDRFVETLRGIVSYCQVGLTVTPDLRLHLYGTVKNVKFAQYKLNVALQTFCGFSALKYALPSQLHHVIAGPQKQNFKTLYEQSAVNIYCPPSSIFSCNNNTKSQDVGCDEIYFVGDKIQTVIAEKLFQTAVIDKTSTVAREHFISSFVRDVLVQKCLNDIDAISNEFGTSIELSKPGQCKNNKVLVLGSSKSAVNRTMNAFMKLCGKIYIAQFETKLDDSAIVQAASGSGSNVVLDESSCIFYGLRSEIRNAVKILNTTNPYACLSILVEQPVELVEFILGKKQGKINKVVSGTGTIITTEKLHQENFRLRLSGSNLNSALTALDLLEDELPAEKSLYIPSIYHKQVIGQGGQTIQQLMRKYNVYMRFESVSDEQYPNIFGQYHTDNVLIRCPMKNKAAIEGAISELRVYVDNLAKSFTKQTLKLSRSHRRILLGLYSTDLSKVENTSQVSVSIPIAESRDTQFIEVRGQQQHNVVDACRMLSNYLPEFDQEFRIPWSKRFADVVGPHSKFNEQVVAPLLLSVGAHTQTFDQVQMQNDASLYSQIVVSTAEPMSPHELQLVDGIITAYLRQNNLDIVDSGEVRNDVLDNMTAVLKSPTVKVMSSPPTVLQPFATTATTSTSTKGTPLSLASLSRMNENSISSVKTNRDHHEDTPTRKFKPLGSNRRGQNLKFQPRRLDFAKLHR